jgi:hypothetical protein
VYTIADLEQQASENGTAHELKCRRSPAGKARRDAQRGNAEEIRRRLLRVSRRINRCTSPACRGVVSSIVGTCTA